MDLETGERFRDKETGEMPASAKVNSETGEAEINRNMPEKQTNTKKFRIPNKNPQPSTSKSSSLQLQLTSITGISRNSPRMVSKELHFSKSGNDFIPCVMFLLPTIVFFYPFIAACLSFIEVFLHVWAHKKNKKLSNKGFYYQSPLHLYVSEFCAACKDERSTNKITNIQDKRNYKFIKYGIDYAQGIVM